MYDICVWYLQILRKSAILMVCLYFVAWIILLCAFYIHILAAVYDCCSPSYYWTGMSFKYTFLFKKTR